MLTLVEPPEMRLTIQPENVSALVCSHKVYADVEWIQDRGPIVDFEPGRPDLTDVGPEGAPS